MSFIVTLTPGNIPLIVANGQTILQAALRQDFYFPWGCDAGTCRICEGRLLQGTLQLKHQAGIIQPDSDQAHAVLCCMAYPLTDITLEVPRVQAPGQFPVKTVSAQITHVDQVNADVKIVHFRLPAGKKIQFSAGQYLELLIDADTSASFSIASAPRDDRTLELHIRANPTSNSYPKLEPLLHPGAMIKMKLGMGDITLHALKNADNILLLAASTGFSQIKSLLEALLAAGDPRPLHVYWGGREFSDLYLHDWITQLATQHANVHYVPVISDQPDWTGRNGFVHKAALEDVQDFSNWVIVGGGSPGMVYAALDDFMAAGMQAEQMVSDVFAYAPR